MMRSMITTLLPLAMAGTLVAACSNEAPDGAPDQPPGADLLAYLDPEARSVGVVDAAAVTAELGLDGAELDTDTDTARAWATHVMIGLPIYSRPAETPLTLALDRSAIIGAAAAPPNIGLDRRALMVVRTDQDWGQLSSRLVDQGYQDRGDGILVTEAPKAQVVYSAVGSDGQLVVAGQDAEVVAAALADGGDRPGPERLSELLAAATGPIRMATFAGPDGGRGCGREYAAGTAVPTTGGEWLAFVGPEPEVDRIITEAGELWDRRLGLRTGEPRLDGEYLRIPLVGESPPWTADLGVQGSALWLPLATEPAFEPNSTFIAEYDCP